MFIILPAYFNTLCNITTWGELFFGEFNVGRVVLGRVVLCPDVPLQVGFSRDFGPGTICLYYFDHISHFPKTVSTNKLPLNHFVLRKTILQYFTHAFICFYAS